MIVTIKSGALNWLPVGVIGKNLPPELTNGISHAC